MTVAPASPLEVKRLILVPAVVTLAVTVLRVAGELLHGPQTLFNSSEGGAGAIVGIVWLAPVFGIYFALKLAAGGAGPKTLGRAVGLTLLGVAVMIGLSFLGSKLIHPNAFEERLLFIGGVFALAAVITLPGWPALFRTLLAYAYAARVPVAVISFFAFWRGWGTHYDAVPPDVPEGWSWFVKFLWLGLFAQLVFWVAFTVLAGMLCGSLALVVARLVQRLRGAKNSLHTGEHAT